MAKRVVCIARTVGALGEEVGLRVAESLRFRYADDEIIERAAEKAGVERAAIEKAEQKPGLASRILTAMALTPIESGAWAGAPVMTGAYELTPSPAYERMIQDVIRETAGEGDVVIVAHGAAFCLAADRDVLRVFVTASPGVRAARLSKDVGIDEDDAQKRIAKSDNERASFLERFYGIRHEEASHYDLMVNTDRTDPAQAARLVAAAAG